MKIKGRTIDDWGNVLFETDGLIDLLMRGNELSSELSALDCDGVVKFNTLCKELDHPEDMVSIYSKPSIDVPTWDEQFQKEWFTPEPYASLDVHKWLLEKCQNQEQINRVEEEWNLFEERDMIPLLRCLVYLVSTFRERKVVWGVGRGSSVASYILYLIGIHKVDSMKYDLDVREFLK
jgi:DNA polymerase III alpha subunit